MENALRTKKRKMRYWPAQNFFVDLSCQAKLLNNSNRDTYKPYLTKISTHAHQKYNLHGLR